MTKSIAPELGAMSVENRTSNEMKRFETVLSGILKVSKQDIRREEAKEKAERADTPKRGRKQSLR